MKRSIISGFLAAVFTILIPVFFTGTDKTFALDMPAPVPVTSEAASDSVPERTVNAIVIHRNQPLSLDESTTVPVEIHGSTQSMSLRDYLIGVLAGEMPADFEPEALKAQAVATRTYTLHRLEGGLPLSDDPAVCQAFSSITASVDRWGSQQEQYIRKLTEAVAATDGQVLTYDGKLISATYFSCSGGKTESAQAVWGSSVPYLVSVDSPGEEAAEVYESQVVVDMDTFLSTLAVESPTVSDPVYTPGGGVDTITIGGTPFTGTQLRSLFGLRSTMFTITPEEDTVTFHVQGFGHRVGMSQYGAQAMAEQGYDYRDILTWYYTGVTLETYQQ